MFRRHAYVALSLDRNIRQQIYQHFCISLYALISVKIQREVVIIPVQSHIENCNNIMKS